MAGPFEIRSVVPQVGARLLPVPPIPEGRPATGGAAGAVPSRQASPSATPERPATVGAVTAPKVPQHSASAPAAGSTDLHALIADAYGALNPAAGRTPAGGTRSASSPDAAGGSLHQIAYRDMYGKNGR